MSGFYLNFNGVCISLPPNCLSANGNGVCTSCVNGFTLSNGLCVRFIINCQTVNPSTNLCQTCISGYYINSNGFCSQLPENCLTASPTGSCLTCLPQFTLRNGLCIRSDPNCQRFDPITNICMNCVSGYYLNGVSFCVLNPANCLTYIFTQQRCTQCISGFRLSPDGVCTR